MPDYNIYADSVRLISTSGGDVQTDHDMSFHCGSAADRTGESNYFWWLEPE